VVSCTHGDGIFRGMLPRSGAACGGKREQHEQHASHRVIVRRVRGTLIVVTGAPGAGKTTLARALAAELRIAMLAKDDVKEALFDALGVGDRDWSRKLGAATYEVLFALAGCLLESGVDCMLESNFSRPEPLRLLPARRVVQLFCTAPPDVVLERYARRERHPGHLDRTIVEELRARLEAEEWRPLDLGGETIVVDTAAQVDVHAIAQCVRRYLT